MRILNAGIWADVQPGSLQPLDNKVLSRLEAAASKSPLIGQGKRMKLIPKVNSSPTSIYFSKSIILITLFIVHQVNPDLKGGLVMEIGDRTIDLSVSSKMAKMNQVLRERV